MGAHVFALILCALTLSQFCQCKTFDGLSSYCLDGQNHKTEPGPEDELHHQCTPWKERSCCTKNTTIEAHKGLYGFNYDHCPEKKMSADCRKHFTQDLCFYECSPDIGPWVQKEEGRKMRRERFYQVPLCATDCNSWFQACADDLTCTDNWSRNFLWKNGTNFCPHDSQCDTFRDIFGNASNFCQRIWDDSWQYTPDSQPCMRMWFDGSKGNPNTAVTQLKIQQLKSGGNHLLPVPLFIFLLSGVLGVQYNQ